MAKKSPSSLADTSLASVTSNEVVVVVGEANPADTSLASVTSKEVVVVGEGEDFMDFVDVRVKSASAPFRRAGLVFQQADQWVEAKIAKLEDDVRRVIAWVTDPNLQVEIFDGENWHKVTEVPEGIQEFLEAHKIAPLNN